MMNSILASDDRNALHALQQDLGQGDDVLPGHSALFMNLNHAAGLKQQSNNVSPSFHGLIGQDLMIGQTGQTQQPMNMGFFQSHNNFAPNVEPHMISSNAFDDQKRRMFPSDIDPKPLKKLRTDGPVDGMPEAPIPVDMKLKLDEDDPNAPLAVAASDESIQLFQDNDVLSGRGGGTNVHPGNRNFRDLINLHRRAYLKARKNDKPAISRAIVRAIRESGGRFLKKKGKTESWCEIGDFTAREKTSQALRQRAPEMRKLLFDSEREEARVVAEDQLRQRQMMLGGMNSAIVSNITAATNNGNGQDTMNPALLQAMTVNRKLPNGQEGTNQQFSNIFSAALLQNGMNRFTPNGT